MQTGIIGLGRMGANIARRLKRGGHDCVVFDRSAEAVALLSGEGMKGADSLEAMAAALAAPRIFRVMLPAGDPTRRLLARSLAGPTREGWLAPDFTILGVPFEPGDDHTLRRTLGEFCDDRGPAWAGLPSRIQTLIRGEDVIEGDRACVQPFLDGSAAGGEVETCEAGGAGPDGPDRPIGRAWQPLG